MITFSSLGYLCRLITCIIIVQNAGSLSCKQQSLLWHNYYRNIHQVGYQLVVRSWYVSSNFNGTSSTMNVLRSASNNTQEMVGNVTWSNMLYKKARRWAVYLANNNLFIHEKKDPGNLFLSAGKPKEPCTMAVQLFYTEEKNYDYNDPEDFKGAGHFTQVVWKNTKQIGAFSKVRNDGKTVVVVKYSPPGNVRGYFAKNVFPPRKPTTVTRPMTKTDFAKTDNSTVTSPGPNLDVRAGTMSVIGRGGVHYVMQFWLLGFLIIKTL